MPQLTQEELEKMTPEQIAELQKQNCIFCHIISGKVASKKIFEDDRCLAILDINPANPGHVLLMPKEHYAIMPLMPEDIVGHLFMVAKGISHACLRAFKAQGTNIFVANGVAAGQKAQHFMLHIIPRKDKDGLACFNLPHKKISEQQMDELRQLLKPRIDSAFGVKEKTIDLDRQKKVEKLKEEAKMIEEKLKQREKPEMVDAGQKSPDGQDNDEEQTEEQPDHDKPAHESKEERFKEDIDLDKIAELLGGNKGG